MNLDDISERIISQFEAKAVGKRLTHAWLGYGRVLFLEFGELFSSEKRKGITIKQGEVGFIAEGDWKLCRNGDPVCTCQDVVPILESALETIKGLAVERLLVDPSSLELTLTLEAGIEIHTVPDGEEPSWSLSELSSGVERSVFVENGTLAVRAEPEL